MADSRAALRQPDAVTAGPGGRLLTNCHVWSPDGEWVAYDTRSHPAGDTFDGTRIKAVSVHTRDVRTLYESQTGACCGVVTWHPTLMRVAFILGPERPTADWSYGPARRQGVTVDFDRPGVASPLDARDLAPPFTPGALRGGSHVHVWHPAGDLVSFTYEDAVANDGVRTIGVSVCGRPVTVPKSHPRNHDGSAFSVLVPHVTANQRPGSDDIGRACEEGWVGRSRTLAFQGTVTTADGRRVPEVFAVDLPADLMAPRAGPVGVNQRRLSRGGVGGPRHWLRSDPAGTRIGFLRPDAAGVVQFWTVTLDGVEVQVSRLADGVASAFTWHPDGRRVAFVAGGRVVLCDTGTGDCRPLTPPCHPDHAPRPEACVLSPDGARVAFVRHLPDGTGGTSNQVCVADVP